MWASGRKVLRLLSGKNNDETSCNSVSVSKKLAKVDIESDLPIELLEQILSRLSLYDNVFASGVCRRWHAVATSIRKGNKNPWLMYFPKSGDICEFYDPAKRKSYGLKLPDLRNSTVCYCKDSWLLLFNHRTRHIFFYCPYTRELIDLPHQALSSELAAFSEPPTSPSCVVFAMKQIRPNVLAISTFHPGDVTWTTVHYHNSEPFVASVPNQAVYCDGLFYCLSKSGYVGVFDHENAIWGVLSAPRPTCMKMYPVDNVEQAKYMAEYNGEIYMIYTYPFFEPFVHKLNKTYDNWELVEDLGGLTIFANFVTSQICSDMVGIIRNGIYFSKVIYYGHRCIMYSLNQARYFPRKEGYNLCELEPYENIWIDAPEDLSIFE